MVDKTVAVVVTYNRLELLKHCISKLQVQTHPVSDIIVVNNGSIDGTTEWLETQTQLKVINQPNSGSAGGFFTGIKAANAGNYKWLWVLDDDGYTADDCLEKLFEVANKKPEVSVWGSLVLDENNHSRLAFDFPAVTTAEGGIDNTVEFIDDWAPIFNGVLLKSDTVKKVGYPDSRLFIWGDEMEYLHRIANSGAIIKTTTKAFFYHPKDRLYNTIFRGEYVYSGPINWKAYCFFRNRAYLGRKYHNSTRSKVLINQFAYLYQKLPLTCFIKAVVLITKAHFDGLSYNLDKKLPY